MPPIFLTIRHRISQEIVENVVTATMNDGNVGFRSTGTNNRFVFYPSPPWLEFAEADWVNLRVPAAQWNKIPRLPRGNISVDGQRMMYEDLS